ncbi:molybdenum cofactor guanylyltransferase [Sphingomonas alba]|uniref:Molybdenum cofactor guanylyltransferase n=1 Tax=Sphingomonas alba TaxID=2908208 RepID=A0ABT0RN92_9SPHN|nr:molybdenum cofactor guanylyltransferase [Sphingomonas alba]MCL6684124.1 molybdenum cofactor guanylyltransferase [Sphingomonas alba]
MKPALVILAGGEGSRIGGSKPQRLLGGVSLLDHALSYARKTNAHLAVAAREERQIGTCEAPVVLDDPSIEGPLGGLVAGLRFANAQGADALLTIPADMPFLPDDLADRLGAAIGENRAAIASSAARLHPVCGLWLPEVLALMPKYLASGRRSLNGLAEEAGFIAVEWPSDPVDPFFNINSVSDLKTAEELLAG